MKKALVLCLILSASLQAHQNLLNTLEKKPVISHALSYKKELLQGFSVGAASALVVDYLRSVLPSADSLKLYDNYGICRDQLTGEVKITTAVISATALSNTDEKKYSAVVRVMSALVGANLVVALKTYLNK